MVSIKHLTLTGDIALLLDSNFENIPQIIEQSTQDSQNEH